MEVSWIARSAATEKGFGRNLIIYAMSIAMKKGAVALVVSPHDKTTAEKVWIKGFRFERMGVLAADGVTELVFLSIKDPLPEGL